MKIKYILILFLLYFISCKTADDILNTDIPPNTEPLRIISFLADGQNIDDEPFVSTYPTFIIEFNNEIDTSKLNFNYDFVEPKQYRAQWEILQFYNDPKKVMIKGGLLDADTKHSISFDSTLMDIYGNRLSNNYKRYFYTSRLGVDFGQNPNKNFNGFITVNWPNPNYYRFVLNYTNEIIEKTIEYRFYLRSTQRADLYNYPSYVDTVKDIPMMDVNKRGEGLNYYLDFILIKSQNDYLHNPSLLKTIPRTLNKTFVIEDPTNPVRVDELDSSKGHKPYFNSQIYKAWGIKIQPILLDGASESVHDQTYNYYITVKMIASSKEPDIMYKDNTSTKIHQAIAPSVYYNPFFYKVYEAYFY